MKDLTLGHLVETHPVLAAEFERLDLDYCCGGQRTLAEACAARALDPDAVAAQLGAAVAAGSATTDDGSWGELGLVELVDRIESVHHTYAWREMERLAPAAEKIAAVHGERHPELAEVQRLVAAIVADLDVHLRKEEQILFPMIRRFADQPDEWARLAPPIRVMLAEHDEVGDLFTQLSAVTNGYAVPDDGCATYRSCYDGLAALQADTHLHIHRENNVLFPQVLSG